MAGEPVDADESLVAKLEELASHLGSDFILALALHMQFKREDEQERRARDAAAAEAVAASEVMLAEEAEGRAAAEAAGLKAAAEDALAAQALHVAQVTQWVSVPKIP